MSHNTFLERFPGFNSSAAGKEIAEILKERHRGRLRALLSAEDAISRGAVQELHRLSQDLFGVDLLE